MWGLGLTIGIFFNVFILFFRGMILGSLLYNLSFESLKYFIIILLIEIIIYLPILIIINYQAFIMQINRINGKIIEYRNYVLALFYSIFVIIIYCLLLKII